MVSAARPITALAGSAAIDGPRPKRLSTLAVRNSWPRMVKTLTGEVHAREQLNAVGAFGQHLADDAGLLEIEERRDQIGEQHPERDLNR